MDYMDKKALKIVLDFILENLTTTMIPNFELFITWKCKTLQNWKYLISTNIMDGKYYELTYNGDKKEWYLDVYHKVQNVVIPEE